MPTDIDLDYWSWVNGPSGATTIPRWAADPAPGEGFLDTEIPAWALTALRTLADDLAVPLSSVFLAAHAKVLGALTGEQIFATGYLAGDGGRPLPCRLIVCPGSWRNLIEDAHRSQGEVWAHRRHFLAQSTQTAVVPGPVFDTIVSPGDSGSAAPDVPLTVPLRVAFGSGPRQDDAGEAGGVLRLHYDTSAIDGEFADRIAGYHLSALAAMAGDPDGAHHRYCLLSQEELDFQIAGLAGPDRVLPDQRAHEIFEERVRAHPDRIAAVHGGDQQTYAELNARANQIGRRLLDSGLQAEDVVAVVTERNLDWMACVLGIFKAGGAYLPLEPHFPPARIARVLSRAEARLVLTESASATNLRAALSELEGIGVIDVDELPAPATRGIGGAESGDLGVPVQPGQLAYLYFTSGSTGEPKGAMCEHAGMLNHLFAKIDDLRIGSEDVLSQTAPQCFDISLWQLVAALLVGGRTHIVEQETILDVERFVDTLAGGGVTVAQVVPSYLEAVLTYLETHPRGLPDLRCVSATGEALKAELVNRWFAAMPGISLVNAYGLTETSDDTNHEVMDAPPADGRVCLGRTVNNARVYIVDEQLVPVPLGAPGVICFAGVCVGRGYVNDPERTAETYLEDPYHPGERLYRGGDIGRWLPGGRLDFLGRRDHQVKISGFRIEIGEIENALARVPGVSDAGVVVAESAGGARQLVAFYSGPQAMDAESIRARLGESLPDYMVPHSVHWCRTMPLTANGKIDRAALLTLAADPGAGTDIVTPQTPTELLLADTWSRLLGLTREQIGRNDHFFDRGGTSLSAIKLVIALNRIVTPQDVMAHPVLTDLAALVDSRTPGGNTPPAAQLPVTTSAQ